MKTKVISLIVFVILCHNLSFGQNKVLLVNGKSINASSVDTQKESVNLTIENSKQTLAKTDILCIISESGKAYTFFEKNNKKIKIPKKDISNDYQTTDIARIFAYKYYKNKNNIGQLYNLYNGLKLTEDEFSTEFILQKKKIKKRTIVSYSLTGFAFILGTTMLIKSMNDVETLSEVQ